MCRLAYADQECATGFKTFVEHQDSIVPVFAGECPDGYQVYTQDYYIAHTAARDVTRCPTGQYYQNGSCVSYTSGSCRSGFVDSAMNAGNIFEYAYGGECLAGYQPISTRNSVKHFNNTVGNSVRCPSGQHYQNGSCVSYNVGACDTGFVDSGMNSASTFIGAYSGDCINGYQPISTRRGVSYVMDKSTAKCGFGYYPTTTGCAANPTAGCPTNYYESVPSASFARKNANGECDTDYGLYDSNTALCRLYTSGNTADYCTPLCEYGYDHTITDTCESPTDNSCTTGYTFASTVGNTPAHCNANTITINWGGADGVFQTGSCTYDGAISTPSTAPTKRGHTFTGWTFTNPDGESNNGGD